MIMVIVMSDRIEFARCLGPVLSNTPVSGTEPTFAKRRGAMTTRSTRLMRRYSTIMALGLMAAFSRLIRTVRLVRSGRSRR